MLGDVGMLHTPTSHTTRNELFKKDQRHEYALTTIITPVPTISPADVAIIHEVVSG